MPKVAEQNRKLQNLLNHHGPFTGVQAVTGGMWIFRSQAHFCATIRFATFAVKMAAKCRNSAFTQYFDL